MPRVAPPYETPRMDPPYERAGTQQQSGNGGRGQRYQADRPVVSRSAASACVTSRPRRARPARRRRSRSRDCRDSDLQWRGGRAKTLLFGLVLVAALSVAVRHSLRHSRQDDVERDEEARLRRDVQGLEDTLWRKQAQLAGVASGLPPEEWGSGGRGDGNGGGGGDGGGGGEGVGGAEWSPNHATAVEPAQAGQRGGGDRMIRGGNGHGTQSSPPTPRISLAGEALFGGPATPPLRPSLESRPGLIREPVPLIVGGTDGSGTRGVVALLQRLRVPMVVEDSGTMDVHGAPYMNKGGWPAVVRPVIEWARGSGYESRAAPDQLRRKTFDALGGLRVKMQQLAGKLRSPGKGEAAAKHVSWGFKAPVSMLLVPFFEEAWGEAKFLHVVRDGRDIAFSGNQTPVDKFYANMFPRGSRELGLREPSLKAMALWDRWNVGVYEWAASRKGKGGGAAASGVDYLLLHAEDLIDPAAKFAAIKDVAEFVGSPLSDWELCCIATEGSRDMGSHTTSRKDRGKITARFGKWKGKVDGNPQLSKLLHDEGERGLRLFGYEPERSLRASGGFQCGAEREPTCPEPSSVRSGLRPPSSRNPPARQKRATKLNAEVPAHVSVDGTAGCVGLKKNMDFQGFDVKVGHFEDHLGCCKECAKVLDCSFFTFDYSSGVCYLKSGKGAEDPKVGLVSGMAQQIAAF